jgi:hypothetical protein
VAYCSFDDVQALLDNATGALRGYESNCDVQIALAEAEVNARLEAAGVATPLGAVPTYVRLATAALTCYYLVRRVNTQEQFNVLMAEYLDQYQRLMRDFVAGQAEIPAEAMPRTDTARPAVYNPHAT